MKHYIYTFKYSIFPQFMWCLVLYFAYLLLVYFNINEFYIEVKHTNYNLVSIGIAFIIPQLIFYRYYKYLNFHMDEANNRLIIFAFSILLILCFRFSESYFDLQNEPLIQLSSLDDFDETDSTSRFYSFDGNVFDSAMYITIPYTYKSKALGSGGTVEENVLNIWFFSICSVKTNKDYAIFFGKKFEASTSLTIPTEEREKDSTDFAEKSMMLFEKSMESKSKYFERVMDNEEKRYYTPWPALFDSIHYEVFIPIIGGYENRTTSDHSNLKLTLGFGIPLLLIIFIFADFKHDEFETDAKGFNQ